MTPPALVLASASAARAALLHGAGLDFRAVPADVDETAIRERAQRAGTAADDIAVALAVAKAVATSRQVADSLVLGADQILVDRGAILAKATNRDDARQTLRRLRGRTHRLISAAALVRDGTIRWQIVEPVDLTMRDMSDAFLETYLDRAGDALTDAVGCYHLEDLGAQLFTKVDGDYFTVLGLPLLAVLQALRQMGHLPE